MNLEHQESFISKREILSPGRKEFFAISSLNKNVLC